MIIESIKSIAETILENKGLFLVDLTLSKDNVIEIFIDSMEGVNIQTCIGISREIEARLNRDEEDFELTVSSAGIGYPFKVEKQFQKNLGKTVEIKLKDGSKLTGTLTEFNEQTITLEYEEKKQIEGTKKKQLVKTQKTIERNQIKEIRDVVSFK